jgi:hypothetical protein
VVQVEHALGGARDLAHVVRDQDGGQRLALADLEEHLHELLAAAHVHARGGLVQDEQRGVGDQRARQEHPLHLAARQARDLLAPEVLPTHAGERGVGRGALVLTDAIGPAAPVVGHDQVLHAGREVAVEGLVLRHVAHVVAGGPLGHVLGQADAHLARVGALEAQDDLEQRALAGAVGPAQAQELALRDPERHVVQHLQLAVALGHVLHLEHAALLRAVGLGEAAEGEAREAHRRARARTDPLCSRSVS